MNLHPYGEHICFPRGISIESTLTLNVGCSPFLVNVRQHFPIEIMMRLLSCLLSAASSNHGGWVGEELIRHRSAPRVRLH